jgi:hypothetical protein
VGSIPGEIIACFNLPNPSNRAMALGSAQFEREISTMNLPRGKGRPVHKADNFTVICESIA